MEKCSLFPLHCTPSFLGPLSVLHKDPKLSLSSWLKDCPVKDPSALGHMWSDEDALQMPLSEDFCCWEPGVHLRETACSNTTVSLSCLALKERR